MMMQQKLLDARRTLVVPGDKAATLAFCVEHFVKVANESIQKRGAFYVALSGGSTPQAIFKALSELSPSKAPRWSSVWLFWGDERAVPVSDPDNNFAAAMKAGLELLPIPKNQIFRMEAEDDLELGAFGYEETLKALLPERKFDLVTLGMGEDGHTASLFPYTEALTVEGRWVVPNFVPEKNVWRMTLTYPALHSTRHLCVYVLGKSKAKMLQQVLQGPEAPLFLPSQKIGTAATPALWIADEDAARNLTISVS